MEKPSQGVKDKKLKSEFAKPVYESDRIKARIKHNFCIPIVKEHNFIHECSVAKMPGILLASFKSETYNPPSESYDPEEHVTKNCLRQLARKEYEHFLGKCYYSMTSYKNTVRITIPHKKNFLIILNTQSSIMEDDFMQLVQNYYWNVVQKIEKLKLKCTTKLQLFNEGEISRKEMLEDFFSDEPKNRPELNASLKKIGFNKKMRYIAIGTEDGIPLARVVNVNEPLLLPKFDEFEYFIETAAGITMRDKFSSILGGYKFNLVVYEKIAVLTIPETDKKFFTLVTFDNKMKDKEASKYERDCEHEFYFPKLMDKITKFITKYDVMKDFKS